MLGELFLCFHRIETSQWTSQSTNNVFCMNSRLVAKSNSCAQTMARWRPYSVSPVTVTFFRPAHWTYSCGSGKSALSNLPAANLTASQNWAPCLYGPEWTRPEEDPWHAMKATPYWTFIDRHSARRKGPGRPNLPKTFSSQKVYCKKKNLLKLDNYVMSPPSCHKKFKWISNSSSRRGTKRQTHHVLFGYWPHATNENIDANLCWLSWKWQIKEKRKRG